MKIAIVHDQLQEFGGAERVLIALKQIFPEADVYTSFYNSKSLGSHRDEFTNWRIITSWADKIPFLKKLYSPLRFITPLIWESFDFSKYDLVISSSGSYMSKGILTKPKTKHICYLHHPPRYLYYYQTAIEWQKYWIVKIYAHLINHGLRLFDYDSSQKVDYFIANSIETKKRIEKFYRRTSVVIYPPVTIPKTIRNPQSVIKNYYLTVSRLARAKHVDVLIKAANKMKFNLKIVGVGRDMEYLKSVSGPTIEFLGNLTDQELAKIYNHAKAYLFASVDEEFGIAPVEAMGYSLPVIAYASGGLKETVEEGKNGYLFNELNENSLIEKIKKLESLSSENYLEMKKNARTTAEKFSFDNFKKNMLGFIKNARITRS